MNQTINAERSVYEIAEELEKEAAASKLKAHHLAQKKLKQCRSTGDKIGIKFWRDVWMHTVLIEQGQKDVQVIQDD